IRLSCLEGGRCVVRFDSLLFIGRRLILRSLLLAWFAPFFGVGIAPEGHDIRRRWRLLGLRPATLWFTPGRLSAARAPGKVLLLQQLILDPDDASSLKGTQRLWENKEL